MKKLFTAILAILYLATSMGATLHFHYCMGKMTSWGLIDHDSKDCSICGMAKMPVNEPCVAGTNHCCKDVHAVIKNDKDQKVTQSDFQFIKVSPLFATANLTLPDIRVSSFVIDNPSVNAPPGIGKIPVFLLHRNFRI